jgi:hypothetical protein
MSMHPSALLLCSRKVRYITFAIIIIVIAVGTYLIVSASAQSNDSTTVNINPGQIIQPNFLGMGYNFDAIYSGWGTDDPRKTLMSKKVKEVNGNGFSRFVQAIALAPLAPTEQTRNWDSSMMRGISNTLQMLKDNKTEVYFVPWYEGNPAWLGGGKIIRDDVTINKWADLTVEYLKYFIETKGFDNIKYWSISNELGTGEGWGSFYYGGHTDKLVKHYQILKQKLEASSLGAKRPKLVTPDMGGTSNFDMVHWATADPGCRSVTDVYCEHIYMPGNGPWGVGIEADGRPFPGMTIDTWDDPEQYPRYHSQHKHHRDFVYNRTGKELFAGEYGIHLEGWYKYTGMDDNPLFPIVFAEYSISMINAKYQGLQVWNFHDVRYGLGNYRYGIMQEPEEGGSIRHHYNTIGLMSRYIRSNSEVYNVTTSNELVRATAVRHKGDGTHTIVVVNRKPSNTRITFNYTSNAPTKAFRKFVLDPNRLPDLRSGDLISHSGKVSMSGSVFYDTVGPNQFVLYTTEYDEVAPAAPTNVALDGNGNLVWTKNTEADLCYYRVYRGKSSGFTISPDNQLSSTDKLSLKLPLAGGYFRITAVDRYGNESAPSSSVYMVGLGANLILNSGFEDDATHSRTPSFWISTIDSEADYAEPSNARTGNQKLVHREGEPYRVTTYQTVGNLEPGLYTLKAWVKSSGGQSVCRMEAKNYGNTTKTINIPASSSFVQVMIDDIAVTSGKCTVAFHSQAPGNTWAVIDDVELVLKSPSNPTPTPTPIQESAQINLGKGWNLISLPLEPVDLRIENILKESANSIVSVFAYDTEMNKYQSYIPASNIFELKEIKPGRGYWVNAAMAVTLRITGVKISTKPVELKEGWNLVGFNSTNKIAMADALKSIVGKYESVFAYNHAENAYVGYIPSEQIYDLKYMEPGQGYWINVVGNDIWVLPE